MTPETASTSAGVLRPSWMDRVLRLAGDVRPGESATALLLSANVFLLLTAYYIIRPVREALILSENGATVRSYAGAILAVAFMVIVPVYSRVANGMNRIRLISGVTLFFVSNLVIFYFLGRAGASIGVSFFLWASIFNLMVIAQFWSFANDVYTEERGTRLFAIIGFGQSLGAVAGSTISLELFRNVDLYTRLLGAAALLLVCLALTYVVHAREQGHDHPSGAPGVVHERLSGDGGFRLVWRYRYLLLIGLLTLTIQFVNTNGEYILAETITETAVQQVGGGASGVSTAAVAAAKGELIANFYAGFQLAVNILSLLMQFFLVSRVFKYLGVSRALFFMPLISLGSYGLMAALPLLGFIRVAKITENATDYSLQNTTRRALFLRTSRGAKYKALQAVETFFWRGGDAFSGLAVFLLVGLAGLGVRPFAAVNMALVGVWLLFARAINRRYQAGEVVTEDTGDEPSS